MAAQDGPRSAGGQVAEGDRTVLAGAGERLAVGAEGRPVELRGVQEGSHLRRSPDWDPKMISVPRFATHRVCTPVKA